MRPNFRKKLILLAILATGLMGCQGDGFRGFEVQECSVSRGQACSTEFQGGEFVWTLDSSIPAGSEFLLFVYNQREVKAGDSSQNQFLLRVNTPSARPPQDETQLASEVSRRSTGFPNDSTRLNVNIPVPYNLLNRSFNFVSDFYVPNPSDYGSLDADSGEFTQFYIRDHLNPNVEGRKEGFAPLAEWEIDRKLRFHLAKTVAPLEQPGEAYADGMECVQENLEWIQGVLGPLKNRGDREGVDVLITQFQLNNIAGMFNFLDRFKAHNGFEIPDSNRGQTLYVSSQLTDSSRPGLQGGGQFCSTTIHEYQHAYNYDQKVLRNLSPTDLDLNSVRGKQPEHDGLNEGYSHIFEELTGEFQNVSRHLQRFLRSPNETPFFLEKATNASLNPRSRGWNTLMIYHALAQVGGRLQKDDRITLNALRDLIDSEEIGLKNLASSVGLTEFEFVESFFRSWATALYDSGEITQFIPPQEYQVINRGGFEQKNYQGIHILDRQSPAEELPLGTSRVFHPLEAEIPLIASGDRENLRPSGLMVRRFIVPEHTNGEVRVSILTNSAPFFTTFVRVR